MTAEAILIGVGAALVVTGVVGVLVFPKPSGLPLSRWQRAVLGGMGVILVTVGVWLNDRDDDEVRREATPPSSTPSSTPPPRCMHLHAAIGSMSLRGSARITTIRDGGTVGRGVDPLLGTYENIASGSDLWLLVYAPEVGRFYPQSQRQNQPAELEGGEFRTSASFGGHDGEQYEVLVVVATRASSRFFSNTLEDWARDNDFRGLTSDELPDDLDEKDCVVVALSTTPTAQ